MWWQFEQMQIAVGVDDQQNVAQPRHVNMRDPSVQFYVFAAMFVTMSLTNIECCVGDRFKRIAIKTMDGIVSECCYNVTAR